MVVGRTAGSACSAGGGDGLDDDEIPRDDCDAWLVDSPESTGRKTRTDSWCGRAPPKMRGSRWLRAALAGTYEMAELAASAASKRSSFSPKIAEDSADTAKLETPRLLLESGDVTVGGDWAGRSGVGCASV